MLLGPPACQAHPRGTLRKWPLGKCQPPFSGPQLTRSGHMAPTEPSPHQVPQVTVIGQEGTHDPNQPITILPWDFYPEKGETTPQRPGRGRILTWPESRETSRVDFPGSSWGAQIMSQQILHPWESWSQGPHHADPSTRSSRRSAAETTLTRNHEAVGSIPRWGKWESHCRQAPWETLPQRYGLSQSGPDGSKPAAAKASKGQEGPLPRCPHLPLHSRGCQWGAGQDVDLPELLTLPTISAFVDLHMEKAHLPEQLPGAEATPLRLVLGPQQGPDTLHAALHPGHLMEPGAPASRTSLNHSQDRRGCIQA